MDKSNLEFPTGTTLSQTECAYFMIPADVILQSDLPSVRIAVFSYLAIKRGIDFSINFSILDIVKWMNRKPNRHANGLNDQIRSCLEQFVELGYLSLSTPIKNDHTKIEATMNGSINEANSTMMMERTQQEQRMLADRIAEGRGLLNAETEQRDNTQQWMELISQYRDITELDADVLNRLLSKIVVHESIDADHVRHLSIEIHFNFKQIPGVESYTPEEQRPYLTRRQENNSVAPAI